MPLSPLLPGYVFARPPAFPARVHGKPGGEPVHHVAGDLVEVEALKSGVAGCVGVDLCNRLRLCRDAVVTVG